MLAIQSCIAKYYCLYTQRAVAFQAPGGFFDSPGIVKMSDIRTFLILYCLRTQLGFWLENLEIGDSVQEVGH